jgi:branched-chain amino acid transport system permease protein
VGKVTEAVSRLKSAFSALNGPNTYGNSRAFWVAFALALIGMFAYPLLTGSYRAGQSAQYLLYGFLALSLCFIWGYCGVLSFGQVAFFGLAGYTFGVVTLNFGASSTVPAMGASVLVATVVALALGYFMFYGGVRDVYVTIITLAFTLVLFTFMAQTAGSEWAIGDALLGGFNGMPGIPNITVGETALTGETFYYLVAALLLVTYLGLRVLVNSRYGRVMVAVREDEDRAEMLGYNTSLVKLLVFTFGGTLAGLGGALFASWGNYVDPSVFELSFAALPVVWVSVGGRESLIGAIAATFGIERLSQYLAATGSEWALVIIGGLLLFVIMFMPKGVVPKLDSYTRLALARVKEKRRSDSDKEVSAVDSD